MKSLSVPEKHQKGIAIKTLKMNDTMARAMGGMDKDEARKFLPQVYWLYGCSGSEAGSATDEQPGGCCQ